MVVFRSPTLQGVIAVVDRSCGFGQSHPVNESCTSTRRYSHQRERTNVLLDDAVAWSWTEFGCGCSSGVSFESGLRYDRWQQTDNHEVQERGQAVLSANRTKVLRQQVGGDSISWTEPHAPLG